MNRILESPKTIVETLTINNYTYDLHQFIPHVSVSYSINCFNDKQYVKNISGILGGDQYNEWIDDDWLDMFIKSKVEEL